MKELGLVKKKIEAKFNKSLQKEVENSIKKCNNVAVLVQFTAKNMMVDSCWGGDANAGVKEKEEEAFKTFYASIKISPVVNLLKQAIKCLYS